VTADSASAASAANGHEDGELLLRAEHVKKYFPIRTGILPYAFQFTANDGASYSFAGKKTIHVASIVESMTVLPGGIFDARGAQVAEALLRFDARSDLRRFLSSFKLA